VDDGGAEDRTNHQGRPGVGVVIHRCRLHHIDRARRRTVVLADNDRALHDIALVHHDATVVAVTVAVAAVPVVGERRGGARISFFSMATSFVKCVVISRASGRQVNR
jgi:hypothetical protein